MKSSSGSQSGQVYLGDEPLNPFWSAASLTQTCVKAAIRVPKDAPLETGPSWARLYIYAKFHIFRNWDAIPALVDMHISNDPVISQAE